MSWKSILGGGGVPGTRPPIWCKSRSRTAETPTSSAGHVHIHSLVFLFFKSLAFVNDQHRKEVVELLVALWMERNPRALSALTQLVLVPTRGCWVEVGTAASAGNGGREEADLGQVMAS